jgi:hypothetical protein
MDMLPFYLPLSFSMTVLLTVWLLYRATSYYRGVLLTLIIWIAIQSVLGINGFYTFTASQPPRVVGLLLPPLSIIALLFIITPGRRWIDSLDLKVLTLLHVIRIPVEFILLGLFIHHAIPKLMTIEGGNYDMLSGWSAVVVFFFGFIQHKLSRRVLLLWNVICLCLLLNIVVHALLSVPTPIQQFGFDQPNIAILYFPFVLLPSVVVPIVLFAHLVAIRRLWSNKINK